MKFYIAFAFLVGLLAGLNANDLGYDTRYYYDLYGSQVADKIPQYLNFAVPWKGSISPKITGPYKARTYKKGKLTTTVYYLRPELRAIAVEYRLPHPWTAEQLQAALKPYGEEWKASTITSEPFFSRLLLRNETLVSESGNLSHYSPYSKRLIILSPTVLAEFDNVLAAEKAKKEKVPEF